VRREADVDRQRPLLGGVAHARLVRLSLLVLAFGAAGSQLALAPASASASPACSAGTCTASFGYRGAVEEWTVPNGVTSVSFVINGAGGGGSLNEASPGNGAKVKATLTVAEGEKLAFVVGGGGGLRAGGYGGGGEGGHEGEFGGGGGGGGSFVFSEAGSLLIAAGGGGGLGEETAAGGDGGQSGTNGGNNPGEGEFHENGGKGATQSSYGTPGPNGKKGAGPTTSTAIQGTGGKGGSAGASGGGGGGGYYGGGGGGSWWTWDGDGGGGGGSSIVNGGTGVTYETGAGGRGASGYASGSNGSISLSFPQPTTATALASSSASPAVGAAVTYTATLSPVPDGGKVVFKDAGSTIAACGEVAVSTVTGKASCEVTYATPGAHTITAAYKGSPDTLYPTSESSATTITATASTITALTSSSPAPATGHTVTYTATVSPVPNSGTVAFEDGGSPIADCGAQAVDTVTGKATCELTYDDPGVHAITALFSGSSDTSYASSSTVSATSVVATETTITSLESNTTSQILGGPIEYTATVYPAPNSGTVDFEDGGAPIPGCGTQAVNVVTGIATCELTYGSPGVHTITAAFSGSTDASYTASSTTSPTTLVAAAITTTSLLSSSASPTVGSPVLYTATVSPAPNSGTIDFRDEGVTIPGCGAQVVDTDTGKATCEVTYLFPAVHDIAATYSGSTDYSYISSATLWYTEITATAPIAPTFEQSTPTAATGTDPETGVHTDTSGATTSSGSPSQPHVTSAGHGSAVRLKLLTTSLATLLAHRSLLVEETCAGAGSHVLTRAHLGYPGVSSMLSLGSIRVSLKPGRARHVKIAIPTGTLRAIRAYSSRRHLASVTIVLSAQTGAGGQSQTVTESLPET
jgi:Bacterial Ig-like domain (group 3)